jgi:hypothetical protein
MDVAAIVIGFCALLFTFFSFYWMNWRKGKLVVGMPRCYAANSLAQGTLVLEFPFVFFNDGPTPIFVQNLRLIFTDEKPHKPLVFTATAERLGEVVGHTLATQFPILGREAMLKICVFQRTPGENVFTEGSYPLELQAMLDDKGEWKTLCHFPLVVTASDAKKIQQRGYYVYDNMPQM